MPCMSTRPDPAALRSLAPQPGTIHKLPCRALRFIYTSFIVTVIFRVWSICYLFNFGLHPMSSSAPYHDYRLKGSLVKRDVASWATRELLVPYIKLGPCLSSALLTPGKLQLCGSQQLAQHVMLAGEHPGNHSFMLAPRVVRVLPELLHPTDPAVVAITT